MVYTYVSMYIAFVTPAIDVRDRDHVCKWVYKIAFWSPPPRISRSIYNLNSRVVLFSDLLILFYLT